MRRFCASLASRCSAALALILISAGSTILPSAQAAGWIDKSSAIFFPDALRTQITASQTYPVFWWNFFLIEAKPDHTPNFERAQSSCGALKAVSSDLLIQIQCEMSPGQYLPLVQEWARDEIFRTRFPGILVTSEMQNRTLSQASLPGVDQSLLQVLRNDPLETWKELKAHAEDRMPLHLDLNRGFLMDSGSGRILIPVQFSFPPNETIRTHAVIDQVPGIELIGAHQSTLQNETQIKTDLHRVSFIGFLTLLIFAIGLYRFRMTRLIPLFAGVLIGTAFAAIVTRMVFGSIHGLTLSFGASIAGLAMDYAFQAGLNSKSKSIWRSNFCGFCTTTVGLVVVMFSSVPLLRQMMFFSLVAMAGSFIIFYLFFTNTRQTNPFSASPPNYVPKPNRFQAVICVSLVGLSFFGLATLKPLLDLRQFDYQTALQQDHVRWFYETAQVRTPYFDVHSEKDFAAIWEEKTFSDQSGISLESLASYLPSPEQAKLNQESWKSAWADLLSSRSPTEIKFFSPYWDRVNPNLLTYPQTTSYISHLTDYRNPGAGFISLWLPKNPQEVEAIQKRFPQVKSLVEVVSLFPKLLSHELAGMVPISIFLALVFHLIYYRRVSYATIALLPFFTGLGLIVLASYVLHFSLTFISVVALILVFGFSLDYGIFATDASIHGNDSGMWSGIILAAISTLAGFFPLVFCKHPVLHDLGTTLFIGGVGTFLGAIWGIPVAVSWTKRRERKGNAS